MQLQPTKDTLKILLHARGEGFHFLAEKFSEAGIHSGQIGRMIQGFAVRVGEGKTISVVRQKLVGRIGFNEEAIRRNAFEGLALAEFAFEQKITGETKIRAEFGKKQESLSAGPPKLCSTKPQARRGWSRNNSCIRPQACKQWMLAGKFRSAASRSCARKTSS